MREHVKGVVSESEIGKPRCPFFLKEGARCVLVPQIKEYDTCGKEPCVVESNVQVSRSD